MSGITCKKAPARSVVSHILRGPFLSRRMNLWLLEFLLRDVHSESDYISLESASFRLLTGIVRSRGAPRNEDILRRQYLPQSSEAHFRAY